MSKETGGTAFPTTADADNWGMTLRDYFAAKAMQGLLAHLVGVEGAGPEGYAKRAYAYADSMLVERDK